MKGLLLKDFYMIKKYCKVFLLMVILFAAAAAVNPENSFYLIYPIIITNVIPVSMISYDEKSKWNLYSDILPCSRAMAVSAKYLLVCFALVICFFVAGGAQAVKMALVNQWNWEFLCQLLFLFITVGLALPGIMLPIIFRYGTEKGRIFHYFSIGAICALATVLSMNQTSLPQPWPLWLSSIAVIVFFIGSWYLSIRLYQKRELS